MLVEEIIGAFTGENRRSRRRKIAMGLVLGATAGTLAGILLAPKSGKETRKDIAEAGKTGYKKTKDLVERGARVAAISPWKPRIDLLRLKNNFKAN